MSSLKFGTSGLRGLVVDLLGAPAFDFTKAFATVLAADSRPGSPVLIGRDLRSSSPAIAAAAAAGIAAAGLRPLDCGALPTPALAFDALRHGWPAVMVTGSHIPDDRNGLKFYTARGEITKAEERAVLEALRPTGVDPVAVFVEPRPQSRDGFRARYGAAFAPDALAGLTIGIYQHSSVARDLLSEIIAALGGVPVPFGRSEGFVPVDTEAHRPEDLLAIGQAASDGRFDAVVSTDGDADRPLVADATGRVLPGDVVGTLAARHLGVGAVVVPVTAASAIETNGGFAGVVRTRVGSPFVIEGMARARREGHGTVAGFEANGGFLLGSDVEIDGRTLAALPTRDSVLPIVAALASVRVAGTTLAAAAAALRFNATASHRLQQVPPERSGLFLDGLRDPSRRADFLVPLGRVAGVDDIDGLRLRLESGAVIHYRASGNAPELRCYAEAAHEADAARIVAWGLAAAADAMGLSARAPH